MARRVLDLFCGAGGAAVGYHRAGFEVLNNGYVVGGHQNGLRAMGAMGIDWMNGTELSQAIPPAYTEWIGRQLIAAL